MIRAIAPYDWKAELKRENSCGASSIAPESRCIGGGGLEREPIPFCTMVVREYAPLIATVQGAPRRATSIRGERNSDFFTVRLTSFAGIQETFGIG